MKTEEIIKVLQAFEEGKKLERYNTTLNIWQEASENVGFVLYEISKGVKIRVKPEPKIEKVELYTSFKIFSMSNTRKIELCDSTLTRHEDDTHRITYNLVDGEPYLESFKIEKL